MEYLSSGSEKTASDHPWVSASVLPGLRDWSVNYRYPKLLASLLFLRFVVLASFALAKLVLYGLHVRYSPCGKQPRSRVKVDLYASNCVSFNPR